MPLRTAVLTAWTGPQSRRLNDLVEKYLGVNFGR